MTLRIRGIETFLWPDDAAVATVLDPFKLSVAEIGAALQVFADDTDPDTRRYTESVAAHLADHLAHALHREGLRNTTRQVTNRYAPGIDHHADIVIARDAMERKLFFEIEFRPNFEKDLVKFRVGHNSGRLAAGVLLVVLDRRAVRGSYTTMPEYQSVLRMVERFRPEHPVAVVGMDVVLHSPRAAPSP